MVQICVVINHKIRSYTDKSIILISDLSNDSEKERQIAFERFEREIRVRIFDWYQTTTQYRLQNCSANIPSINSQRYF